MAAHRKKIEVVSSYLVKSNNYIMSHYNLSEKEQKILFLAQSKIVDKLPKNSNGVPQLDSIKDSNFECVARISIKEVKEFLGLTSTHRVYEIIDEITDKLHRKVIHMRYIDKDGERAFQKMVPVPRSKYEAGFIEIELLKSVVLELVNLNGNFTKLSLPDIKKIKNQYTLRMYEFLKSSAYKRYAKIELDEIRQVLALDYTVESVDEHGRVINVITTSKYPEYANLKRYILEPIKEEIEETTNLRFEYSPVKEGKKNKYLDFTIYFKDDVRHDASADDEIATAKESQEAKYEQMSLFANDEFDTKKYLYEARTFLPTELSDKDIYTLLNEVNYNIKVLKEKAELLSAQRSVKNVMGWLLGAIRNDYREMTIEAENIKKKNSKNKFLNFPQREYDSKHYDDLEKILINKQYDIN